MTETRHIGFVCPTTPDTFNPYIPLWCISLSLRSAIRWNSSAFPTYTGGYSQYCIPERPFSTACRTRDVGPNADTEKGPWDRKWTEARLHVRLRKRSAVKLLYIAILKWPNIAIGDCSLWLKWSVPNLFEYSFRCTFWKCVYLCRKKMHFQKRILKCMPISVRFEEKLLPW